MLEATVAYVEVIATSYGASGAPGKTRIYQRR